jgi:tetratricopeptide (TPR) repeat protein
MTVLGERFELGPVIAEGGGGVVHHAWDRLSARAAAVKLLHPRGNPMDLLREVKLLADLEHPRIVRYLGHGTAPDRRTFIATEWLEGKTLAALIARGPLSLPDAMAATAAAAEGLRAAHARGVVHRDVKPSNLFAVGGAPGQVKLIDFGVATSRASLRDDERGGMAGTPAYVSPEQARRTAVDARSDVFSLGCVLYECLTGARLFAGEDVPAVLRQIQFGEIPPIGQQVPGLPGALESLLARMLAKAANARPTLEEILATLASLGSAAPQDAAMRLTDREERVWTVLMARTAEDDPDRAEAALAGLGSPRRLADGTPLLVLGPSDDAGQDAPAAARLAQRAAGANAGLALALVTGRGQLLGGLPLGPLLDEAAGLLVRCPPGRIRLGEESARLLEGRFEIATELGAVYLGDERAAAEQPRLVLGRRTPFVGRGPELARLEAILAEVREGRARGVLVTGEAGLGKSRLRHELLERAVGARIGLARAEQSGEPFGVLRGLVAAADPGVVLPALEGEDPRSSADRLRSAWLDWLQGKWRRPLILAVEDAQLADHPSRELLAMALDRGARLPVMVLALARAGDGLSGFGGFERLELGPLPEEACRALASALGGSAELAGRAAGNPLFLEELVRAEAAGEPALPDTVAALVQARIDRLPAPLRRIIRAASILGSSFATRALQALLPEVPAGELAAHLLALAREELLVAGEGSHAFRHAIVGEAAYATLTDGDRALGHRLAGQWLATQPAPGPAEIARHFDRAGDRTQAGPWYVRAAELALAASDLDQALALSEHAAACGLRPDELGAAKIVEARARFWRAEYLEAELAAKRALRAGAAGSALWYRALGELCQSLGERGDYAEIERQLEKAVGSTPAPGAEPQRWGCLLSGIGYLAVSSRRAAARTRLDALVASGASFDEATRARIHACRALLAAAGGQTFQASQESAAALALYEKLGDRRRRCEMAADLGSAALELGELDRGIELLRGVVAEAGQLGAARIATAAQVNLVQGLAWRGQWAEAAAIAQVALDSAREQGNRRLEAGCFTFMAEAALLAGEIDEGERLARRALARAEGVEALRPAIQAVLAWALLSKGGGPTATALAREAVDLAEREGRPEINEWLLLRVRVEALAASGLSDEARGALRSALERLRRHAETIADPVREKFLSLPHPARLRALAAAWQIDVA